MASPEKYRRYEIGLAFLLFAAPPAPVGFFEHSFRKPLTNYSIEFALAEIAEIGERAGTLTALLQTHIRGSTRWSHGDAHHYKGCRYKVFGPGRTRNADHTIAALQRVSPRKLLPEHEPAQRHHK
jgi:hypothetical protein